MRKVAAKRDTRRWWIGAIILPVAVTVVAVFQPDIREFLVDKLFHREPTATVSATNDNAVPELQSQSPVPAPKSTMPPVKQESKIKMKGHNSVAGNNVNGEGNVVGNGNSTQSAPGGMIINGGTVTNPTINNQSSPTGVYELSDNKRQQLLKLLSAQTAKRDTLRIACIQWSEESCVAAGRFLLIFSQAGWQIDEDKVFYMEPQIPMPGIALVTHPTAEDASLPKQPPHLGRWRLMDETEKTITLALRSVNIPTTASADYGLKEGTLGIYFGPAPK